MEAKQEEFDARNTFKNQMDHWRLDEDEAAFEEERLQKLREQQQEATRLHEEGAEFYRLARAAQERPMQPHAAAPAPKASAASSSGAEKRKQKAQPEAHLQGAQGAAERERQCGIRSHRL